MKTLIKVQTNREFNNGVPTNRTMTLTIGDGAPLVMDIEDVRNLHNILTDMLEMENNFEENIEKDSKLQDYAGHI